MFQTPTTLKPLIATSRYGSQQAFDEDCKMLAKSSWQLAATTSQLARPGDNIALTIFGIPVLVRNCDGQLLAFRNVCAHRHCKLFDDGATHSDAFKCRYHGWQYGADGRTRKLPGAKYFPNFDRESFQLESFSVATCGQFVFVGLGNSLPTLEHWLGDYYQRLHEGSDPTRWRLNYVREYAFEVDWKIPLEGSLESYHLDEVHPKTFGSDPGEEALEHCFHTWGSDLTTHFRGESILEKLESWSVRSITGSFHNRYTHLHAYPNLMASLAASLTLVYQVRPTAPGLSVMTAFGLGPIATRLGMVGDVWAAMVRRSAARAAETVLNEDAAIFPHVQAGIRAATRPGIFGRCEERLHSFHQYLANQMLNETPRVPPTPENET